MAHRVEVGDHGAELGAVGRCAVGECVDAYVGSKREAGTAAGKVGADVVCNRPRVCVFLPT